MSKKLFSIPVIMSTVPGDASDIGNGSGMDGVDPITGVYPMSYTSWLESKFAADIIGEGDGINEDDYATWWDSQEGDDFTQEAWEKLNPGLPWDEYFG